MIDRILWLLARSPGVRTVDITGGAPELHPRFRELVGQRARWDGTIDRCNLTILEKPGQEDTAEFLSQSVEVIASCPATIGKRRPSARIRSL